jgi:UDP-N-acetyl-D-mannosaminuronic acid dehydrogenase
MPNSNLKITTVKPSDSIDFVVRKMANDSRVSDFPGFAVVIEKDSLKGVVTDGDIRRSYANNISFKEDISKIMSDKPITISDTLPESKILKQVTSLVQKSKNHSSDWVRHVLVINQKNQLINVLDFHELLESEKNILQKVAVFGMGYVGITLAVSLANKGHEVVGLDINLDLINNLSSGITHVYEPGLDDMLRTNIDANKINFHEKLIVPSNVYIIAVGTPIGPNSRPSLSALEEVLQVISENIKKGDQVMLRSTVPVGTTRSKVIPFLERKSGLKAGRDFFVTFAPERTVEGSAMHELKSLPQVIGGYSSNCTIKSIEFWSSLTPNVIQVKGLEASELVKLANNTFRDLSFAFANELALVGDKFNVNAFDLIHAANDGYPRNPIPLPSPGVGGYCLTKDPILFSSTVDGQRDDAVLGLASRKVNERAGLYPINLLNRFAKNNRIQLKQMKVLIIGVAFKGIPETSDIRGSIAVDLLKILKDKVDSIYGWDAIVDSQTLSNLGFLRAENIEQIIKKVDAVLILNNHPENTISALLVESIKPKLIFDGWSQLDQGEVEKIRGLSYSTMGYLTHNSNLQ